MTDTSSTPPEGDSDQQPATEPDWKGEARKWEQRAKENQKAARENSDAAKRLQELEDAQKTELQRAAERAEAAERRATELEQAQQLATLRSQVSSTTNVPTTLLAGPAENTVEGLSAFADAIKTWVQSGAGGTVRGPVVSNPGGIPANAGGGDERAFARALFGNH
jgi:hypothetical protein